MAVRIGKVEIRATRRLEASEARSLVNVHAPGHVGGATQDLGRDQVLILLEGSLVGPEAAAAVEALRAAHASGQPQAFASDVVLGTEVTDVVVEALRVVQRAGTVDRWDCSLRLREHVLPPEPPAAGLAAVAKGVAGDAERWMKRAGVAMRVLRDPSTLAAELLRDPELLGMLGADDLARSLLDNVRSLGGPELRGFIDAIRKIDPQKALDVIDKVVRGEDPTDAILALGGEFGGAIFEGLTGEPLPPGVQSLIGAAGRLGDLIQKLKALAEKGHALLVDFEALRAGGPR